LLNCYIAALAEKHLEAVWKIAPAGFIMGALFFCISGSFRRSASKRHICRSAARDAERPKFHDHAERRHKHITIQQFSNSGSLDIQIIPQTIAQEIESKHNQHDG
jgi:hypothetical protein